MDIAYAFFAETAQITSDGRLNLLGADLPSLRFSGAPPWTSGVIYLVVAVRLEREDCGHLYHFQADMRAPDGTPLEPHMEQDIIAPVPDKPESASKLKIVLQMNGLEFNSPGVYQMAVRIEDKERKTSKEDHIRLGVEGSPQA